MKKNNILKIVLIFLISLTLISFVNSIQIFEVEHTTINSNVIITWETNEESNSSISYGIDNMDQKIIEEENKTSHSLTLENLEPEEQYSYVVTSCSDNSCESSEMFFFISPSAFTSEDFFFEVWLNDREVPTLYNKNKISLTVKSIPGADIYLKVNGVLKRHKRLGNSGEFTFENIELEDQTELIFESIFEQETITRTFNLELDLKPPLVNINQISEIWLEPIFNLNGTVDEDVTLEIYFSYNNGPFLLVDIHNLVEGLFSVPISFPERDGNYIIQLKFFDLAGNIVTKELSSYVDLMDPILKTDPPDLNRLSPSYIDQIRINGETEPGARVVVFVNNISSTKGSWSPNLLTILRRIGQLVEGEREYITTANDQGEFILDIYLSRQYKAEEYLGQRYTDQKVFGRNVTERIFTNVPAWENKVEIYAIDRAGRLSDPLTADIILTTCDYGGDWQVNFESLTPNVLIPNHLLEGIGGFGFNYKLEWQGPGEALDASIVGRPQIRLPNQQILNQMDEKGYELAKQIIDRASFVNMFEPNNKMGTVKVNLKKYPGSESDLMEYTHLNTMLEMDINYRYDHFGQSAVGRQVKCVPVTIALDKRIDFARPEGLLRDSVKFLNGTINTLDTVIDAVQKVRKFIFYSSIASNVVYYGSTVKQKLACWKYASSGFVPKEGGNLILPAECDDYENSDDCKSCWDSILSMEKMKRINSWISDRVFCPAIPSLSLYIDQSRNKDYYIFSEEGDEDPMNMIHPMSACYDGNEYGEPDSEGGANYLFNVDYDPSNEYSQQVHANCKAEYDWEWRPACLSINDIYRYSFNRTDVNFFERFVDTVDNVCKPNPDNMEDIIHKPARCCVNHPFNQEWNIDDGCYYIINPRDPPNLDPGIYYASFDYDQSCIKDRDGNCQRDEKGNRIRFDLNQAYGTVELFQDSNGEYQRIDDINKYNSDNEYKTKMNNMCLSHYIVNQQKKYVIDPTSSMIRSAQCGCIPALEQYLIHYRNMADATKLCFEELLITGEATAGFCKAMLTQYICDLVYDAIRCGGKFFSVKVNLGSSERPQDKPGLSGFFGAMSKAGEDVSSSVRNRYGNTQTFRTLFSERTLLHSACIAAFTGDWNVEMENLFSMATDSVPVKSMVFIHPATRRFISSNPFNGYTNHIYNINLGILAGADMSFNLRLVCSSENTCDTPNGECDCFRSGIERSAPTAISGNLRSGEVWTKDSYIEITNAGVRYDKAILTYKYRNNEGQEITEVVTKRITPIGGIPPTCSFDIGSFQFLCQFDIGDRGYASFGGIIPRIQGGSTYGNYRVGNNIILDGQVIKRSPGYDPSNPDVQPVDHKAVWLKAKVTRQDGSNVAGGEKNFQIERDGTHNLDEIFSNMNLVVSQDWFLGSNNQNEQSENGINIIRSGRLENDVRISLVSNPENPFREANIVINTNGEIEYEGILKGNKLEETYTFTPFEFKVDGTTITLSGDYTPRIGEGQFSYSTTIRRSSIGGERFNLRVGLYYSDEVDPNRIDFTHPITNGGVTEEYDITFTATPIETTDLEMCKPNSQFEMIDLRCSCGTEACPKDAEHLYCYNNKCSKYPACEAVRNVHQPSEDLSKITDSRDCYCGDSLYQASTDASKTTYCYIKEGDNNPKIHNSFENAKS